MKRIKILLLLIVCVTLSCSSNKEEENIIVPQFTIKYGCQGNIPNFLQGNKYSITLFSLANNNTTEEKVYEIKESGHAFSHEFKIDSTKLISGKIELFGNYNQPEISYTDSSVSITILDSNEKTIASKTANLKANGTSTFKLSYNTVTKEID